MAFRRGQLRYFVAVADEGQMTRAAHKLHIAQPALSQAIAQLESELGLELLERHARGVTLTPAGEAFLPKARAALAAETDAVATAQSLARSVRSAITVGHIGPPPLINAPELFAVFAEAHADAEISFRELPFPRGSTASWLEDVDVAFCHPPSAEPEVRVQALRTEPRAVVAPKTHPLAQRSELTVAEVLDETFISYHPAVQPMWAGFHSLDDHRGTPAPRMTADRAVTPSQMFRIIAERQAITAVPASDAAIILKVLRGVVAVPVRDAHPAVLSLVWRRSNHNSLVQALAMLAASLRDGGADGRLPAKG
jgi:LysR family transcriptional regulator, benzoate and cis,cis-muconate-responsive activator of ben and cat genes